VDIVLASVHGSLAVSPTYSEGDLEMAFDGVCNLGRVGIEPNGRAQLELSAADGSFPSNWFLSKADLNREILAIALAAKVSGRSVWCQIDDPTKTWSDVYRFLVV
jgi:hypothetical protein